MSGKLLYIYWDQLSLSSKALKELPIGSHILMAETINEFTYVNHHKKKLVFLLSAYRHFYNEINKKHKKITYYKIDQNLKTITDALNLYLKKNKFNEIITIEPSEYRQEQELKKFCKSHKIKLTLYPDEKFITTKKYFKEWAKPKLQQNKKLLMEDFYHILRQDTCLLMEDKKPCGGKWNYDKDNRKSIPKGVSIPSPISFRQDNITKEVINTINRKFSNHLGDTSNFNYAISRAQAKKALKIFFETRIKYFGDYQDAMLNKEPFLFHSIISPYLNIGLLDPLDVCKKVEDLYFAKKISIATAEGFIRQIIGWREFIRGIYWLHMPKYKTINHLKYKTKLPDFYWSGDTKLNCLKQAITSTKEHAYSHHIQRLMVTGNFAALIGVNPKEIHEWYLAVYLDAHEWVELPNTLGMATFADGGIVGTKPYISSGNYINKMSNFCKDCDYNVTEKTGEKACPFNYLYWNYLIQHKKTLSKNPRLRMPYNILNKMPSTKIRIISSDSLKFIEKL